MGVKIKGVYNGGLEMQMAHGPSGVFVRTDPPTDNGGRGASFSPTDLVATGLGACMMSVMALEATKLGLDLTGMYCEVEKIMALPADPPRRISQLIVFMHLPERLKEPDRIRLQEVGNNCPVIHSLKDSLQVKKTYVYDA